MSNSVLQKARNHLESGKIEKAKQLCSKYLKSNPGDPEGLYTMGLILLNRQEFHAALDFLMQVAEIRSDIPSLQYNLGFTYHAIGELEQAVNHHENAIRLQPDLMVAHRDLCVLYREQDEFERSIAAGKKAIALNPKDPAACYQLATTYHHWRDFDAAFNLYMQAYELAPDHPAILKELGHSFAGQDEPERARECFERILSLVPNDADTLRQLMMLNRYEDPEHLDIVRAKSLLQNHSLDDEDRTAILFLLSKAYRDCGLYKESFEFAMRANEIQDTRLGFIPQDFSDYIDRNIRVYNKKYFDVVSSMGNPSEKPVFIVGTPRSGTTLTEQILCSHSQAHGAGELAWFSKCANALAESIGSSEPYPECMQNIDPRSIVQLSEKFLQYIDQLSVLEPCVIDKMPGNFLHIGLIRTLFPNARIIHCRRDPRDAALSMYFGYFPGAVIYSYNLEKLGSYYADYLRLMQHWRMTLDQDRFLEIDYESLVSDQENETRRLLDFLDLEWEPTCMEFHKTRRRINTASQQQASRPMYTSSVGKWKSYEKELQPFIESLELSVRQHDVVQ